MYSICCCSLNNLLVIFFFNSSCCFFLGVFGAATRWCVHTSVSPVTHLLLSRVLHVVSSCLLTDRNSRSIQHIRQRWRRAGVVVGAGHGDAIAGTEPHREGTGRHD